MVKVCAIESSVQQAKHPRRILAEYGRPALAALRHDVDREAMWSSGRKGVQLPRRRPTSILRPQALAETGSY